MPAPPGLQLKKLPFILAALMMIGLQLDCQVQIRDLDARPLNWAHKLNFLITFFTVNKNLILLSQLSLHSTHSQLSLPIIQSQLSLTITNSAVPAYYALSCPCLLSNLSCPYILPNLSSLCILPTHSCPCLLPTLS